MRFSVLSFNGASLKIVPVTNEIATYSELLDIPSFLRFLTLSLFPYFR